jgi:hypothetical protein
MRLRAVMLHLVRVPLTKKIVEVSEIPRDDFAGV